MLVLIIAIIFLLGAAVGSFLNVCIDRLPAGKSLAFPPSHCDACQRRLSPKDLVPIISYLWLRGRCRYCRSPITARVPWVEFLTGSMFALLYGYYGAGITFYVSLFYFSLFLVLAVIDLEHNLILNKIVYPATVAVLVLNIFLPSPGFLNGVIGGLAGLLLLFLPALFFPRGMGMGDAKMAGLIGLVTGFPLVFVALFLGIVTGGLMAITLLVLRLKKRKETMPFGPFLALGTVVTLVWGDAILAWYTGFFIS